MPWKFFGSTGLKKPPIQTTEEYPGEILLFAGGSAPDGYLLCNGAVINTVTNPEYAALHGVLTRNSTVGLFGAFTATTATLPDYRDRFMYGAASGADVGVTGGTNTPSSHVLPAHQHTVTAHTHGISDSHRHEVFHDHDLANHSHTAASINTGNGTSSPSEPSTPGAPNTACNDDTTTTSGVAVTFCGHNHDVDGTTGTNTTSFLNAVTTYTSYNSPSGTNGTNTANVNLSSAQTFNTVTYPSATALSQNPVWMALNFIIKY